MAAHQWQAEIEPLLHRATLVGAHDRRRAETQDDALGTQLVRERLHPRDGGRGVAEEWVEHDGRCASRGGGAGVIEGEDGGHEIERGGRAPRKYIPTLALLVRDDSVHGQRRIDPFATLGQGCLVRPVTALEQLVDRLLPEMIELADREKESGAERAQLEPGEDEWRFAESAELLAQRGSVEGALGGRRQIDIGAHRHRLAVGGEDRLERSTGAAEQPHVESRASRAQVGRQRRVARAGSCEQGGLGRANHPPSVTHRAARGQRDCLVHGPVAPGEGAHGLDREADVRSTVRVGSLEPHAVADHERRADLDDELTRREVVAEHHTQLAAAVVRMLARDVAAPRATAVHPAGIAAAVDLHQWLDVGGRRWRAVALGKAVETYSGFFLRPSTLRQPTPASAISAR